MGALEILANETAEGVLRAVSKANPPSAACALCLFPSQDYHGNNSASVWCSEIAVTLQQDRDQAIEGLDGLDRYVAGWTAEQAYTGMIPIEGEPTAAFHSAYTELKAELDARESKDPSFFAYRYTLDCIAGDVTSRVINSSLLVPLAAEFVAHPDYEGDFDSWLPVSLRRIAPADKLDLLEEKGLLPPIPELPTS